MATQETLTKPTANGHRAETGDAPIENHPLAGVIGAFRDDPEYDALLEQIAEHRRRVDAEEGLAVGASVSS